MRQIPHIFVSGSQNGGVAEGWYEKKKENMNYFTKLKKRAIKRKPT